MEQDAMFETEFLDESILITSKVKRSRSSNFTSQEEDVLLSLVEKYSHIVESKQTNAVTWQQKNEMWEKIAEELRCQCNIVRSSKNLRDKYENIKRKAKTAIANDRNQQYKTGGGPYSSKISNNDERINALLGKSVTGLYNENDCDMIQNQNGDSLVEIDFLEDECEAKIKQKDSQSADESNSWKNWNSKRLMTKKAKKLNFKNRIDAIKNEPELEKQAAFFEKEDKRAEERHKLQIDEINLKIELLKLEISLKKLEIEKFS